MGTYQIDTTIVLTGTFASAQTGQPMDPSAVNLFIMAPDNTTQEQGWPFGNVAHPSTGVFTFTFTVSISGTWTYKWQGTGAVVCTSPDTTFQVQPSILIPG